MTKSLFDARCNIKANCSLVEQTRTYCFPPGQLCLDSSLASSLEPSSKLHSFQQDIADSLRETVKSEDFKFLDNHRYPFP